MSKTKIFKILLFHLLIGTAVATVVLLSDGFCLFKRLTGVDCPGCGLTRAYLAFFKGEFRAAFSFHSLFLLIIPTVLLAGHIGIVKKKCKKSVYIASWIILSLLIAAFVVRYIIKIIFIYA